ncbi:MAG: hypothetical protein HY658_05640 [Actinobacteria bacterium]|nr:hypothetical protein [Actinomycetota bacterium]
MRRYTTRQLIWLESSRRRLPEVGGMAGLVASAPRRAARPRSVGLSWDDLEGWLRERPDGLPPEDARELAEALRPDVEELFARWPRLAEADDDARRAAVAALSFGDSRAAFTEIEERVTALSDWAGLTDLFEEVAADPLTSRARALLATYLEIHPGLQP